MDDSIRTDILNVGRRLLWPLVTWCHEANVGVRTQYKNIVSERMGLRKLPKPKPVTAAGAGRRCGRLARQVWSNTTLSRCREGAMEGCAATAGEG
jgi:hypothetical protein